MKISVLLRRGALVGLACALSLTRQLPAAGELDQSVNLDLQDLTGIDYIDGLAHQPDGSTIFGGRFSKFNPSRTKLARIFPTIGFGYALDGWDPNGNNPNINTEFYATSVQADGSVVLGGPFIRVGGFVNPARNYLARVNGVNGLVDGFNPNPNGFVNGIVPQPDGRLIVFGSFITIAGSTRSYVARLNADGGLDTSFSPYPNGQVYGVLLQPDGSIILSGAFTTVSPNGGPAVNRLGLARFNAFGVLDPTFLNQFPAGPNFLAAQGSNLLVAFNNGVLRRMDANGNADGSFIVDATVNGGNQSIETLGVQADGKIIVGGNFSAIAGASRANLARLLPNGAIDPTFTTGTSPPSEPNFTPGTVRSVALQANGGIFIGGYFEEAGGVYRKCLARLLNDPSSQNLSATRSRITWLRSAASPEVQTAYFEYTEDGTSYYQLPAPQRIAGGWELTGLNLPARFRVRARGFAAGGRFNGSMSLHEAKASCPSGVVVTYNGQQVPDEDLTPSAAEGTDFGTVPLGEELVRTFTVTNNRTVNLALAQPNSGSDHPLDFVPSSLPSTLPPGGSATFTITFRPGALGLRKSSIIFSSDDPDVAFTYFFLQGQGGPVASFNPAPNADIFGLAEQPDGKVIASGDFTQFGGQARGRIARLTAAGGLDSAFHPNANESVRSISLQPDGRIVIAGFFTTLQPPGAPSPITRRRVARLLADGTVDPTFPDPGSNDLTSAVLQPDGKILLNGFFTSLQPPGAPAPIPRNYSARLNADGSLDAGFHPNLNNYCYNSQTLPDGRILLAGDFTTVQPPGAPAPITRRRVVRLLADGTVDPTFTDPNVAGTVLSALLQPDGKILICGFITQVATQNRNFIARLNSDGTLDTAFNPSASARVDTMALQSDGKILVAGFFTSIGGQPRNRLARLNSDGTADPTFDPNADNVALTLCVLSNGAILAGGQFANLGGSPRARFARLANVPATQALSITPSRLEWLRGGASPEASFVTFEHSTDGGANYTSLGQATRISGGWEMTGLNLTAPGPIRARARTGSGHTGNGLGLVEASGLFHASELLVQGNGLEIVQGDATPSFSDHTDFGGVAPTGGGRQRTFTIANTGTATLTVGTVVVSGPQAADFQVVSQPAGSVAPGGSTTFTVLFDASALGLRQATLSFPNSDGNESPFTFAIQGSGAASDPTLSALAVRDAVLAPTFAPGTAAYASNVGRLVASTTVTATAVDPASTVQVRLNGGSYAAAPNGAPSGALALNTGPNTLDVLVTAPDGVATQLYTVALTRSTWTPGDADPPPAAVNGAVFQSVLQPDGRIVLGGPFSNVGGQARSGLARLQADGTLDPTFNGGVSGNTYGVAVQDDGRILIAGDFTAVNGAARAYLARLDAAGATDATFTSGADGPVYALALQKNGQALVGGAFFAIHGASCRGLARLLTGGGFDSSFYHPVGGTVTALGLQTDGGVLVGGAFGDIENAVRARIGRITAANVLDPILKVNAASFAAFVTVVQADGSLLVAGDLTSVGGLNGVNYLVRFLPSGVLDLSFRPVLNDTVRGFALQADGRILLGGRFTLVNGQTRNRLARLNPDGSLDSGFAPSADGEVFNITLQADGRMLVGGNFTTIGGAGPAYFTRLQNDAATQSLTVPNSSRVQWLRGGSAPEAQGVSFEHSLDGGGIYTPLGQGVRIPGGWELTGLALPAGSLVRARARLACGIDSAGSGLVESVAIVQPTALQAWRQVYFGSPLNAGAGADENDFDLDGVPNLAEFAFGTHPLQSASAALPTLQFAGGEAFFAFPTPPGVSGVVYAAEWSTTLQAGDWHPLTDTGVPPQHRFALPLTGQPKVFLRLRVSEQ